MIEAKTPADLYKGNPVRDYLHDPWTQCLDRYYQLGWHLMKNKYRSKNPGWHGHWKNEEITRDQADKWVMGKMVGNISVILGPSQLIAIDYDNPHLPRPLQRLSKKTMTMRTTRGYQFILRTRLSDVDIMNYALEDGMEEIKNAYRDYADQEDRPFLELFTGVRYCLLPMSITCTKDHGNHTTPNEKCVDGKNHDYRVREWLKLDAPVLEFEEAVKILL